MPFITFIYRIENTEKIFYGKYVCDDVSNNHEGIDIEIKPIVINGINEYRNQKGLNKLDKKVFLGILSFSENRHTYIYSSDEEIKCFDFYYINCYDTSKTYINGKFII
jgi:hypothetical protein